MSKQNLERQARLARLERMRELVLQQQRPGVDREAAGFEMAKTAEYFKERPGDEGRYYRALLLSASYGNAESRAKIEKIFWKYGFVEKMESFKRCEDNAAHYLDYLLKSEAATGLPKDKVKLALKIEKLQEDVEDISTEFDIIRMLIQFDDTDENKAKLSSEFQKVNASVRKYMGEVQEIVGKVDKEKYPHHSNELQEIQFICREVLDRALMLRKESMRIQKESVIAGLTNLDKAYKSYLTELPNLLSILNITKIDLDKNATTPKNLAELLKEDCVKIDDWLKELEKSSGSKAGKTAEVKATVLMIRGVISEMGDNAYKIVSKDDSHTLSKHDHKLT